MIGDRNKVLFYKIKLSMVWKWIRGRKIGNRNKIKNIIIVYVILRGNNKYL